MESTKSNLQENQKKSYQCKPGQQGSQSIDDCASCIFYFVHTSLVKPLCAHFKSNTNRGRVHSFQLYRKAVGKGRFPTLSFKYFNTVYIFGISVLFLQFGVLFIKTKLKRLAVARRGESIFNTFHFFFCNVCSLRLNASVAAFLIVFPTAALEAPFSIYLQPENVKLFRGAALNTVYPKYSPVLLTKGIESNIW